MNNLTLEKIGMVELMECEIKQVELRLEKNKVKDITDVNVLFESASNFYDFDRDRAWIYMERIHQLTNNSYPQILHKMFNR